MARLRCIAVVPALLLVLNVSSASAQCGDTGVWLQVLGSGGPGGLGRASAGYIVWIDGVSRIMVDAGGGTFARFHEAGAKVPDLQLLALSHFHPDHASEVPALLWTQPAAPRIAGPSGNDGFPSVDQFLQTLFAPPGGVFRVIGSRLALESITIDAGATTATEVLSDGPITVRGIGVPHADAPTIGYRVDVGGASIGFASDQIGTNPAWTELIREVDVLVAHFIGSEKIEGPGAALHARPSVWGQMASDARADALLLSHIGDVEPSNPNYEMLVGSDFEGSLAHLRSRYEGPATVAEDLMCLAVE